MRIFSFLLSTGGSNGCKLFRCFTNCILEY
nr:MAG TPA: hypothetical protein [Caudoviricetes sp.]DAT83072.1 MAG TPA: hypothetical protein [Caudoviricetes sp.]